MAKFKIFAVMCLLILTSCVFFACGNNEQINITFTKDEMSICLGDRVDLQSVVETDNFDLINWSVSDTNFAYIINNKTLVALKAGQVKLFANVKDTTKTIEINIYQEKTQLKTPVGLEFDVNSNSLKWVSVPGALSYEVQIENGEKQVKIVVAKNELNFNENNMEIVPNCEYKFAVRAIASQTSTAFSNSDLSKTYVYNQLPSVENLKYDINNNKITFNYNAENNEYNLQKVVFDLSINEKTYRLESSDSGEYEFEFTPQTSGETVVSVVAKMSGRDNSISQKLNLIKLEKPEINLAGSIATATTNVDAGKITIDYASLHHNFEDSTNAKAISTDQIILNAGEKIFVTAFVEKIVLEQIIDEIRTYYLPSEVSKLQIEKLGQIEEMNVNLVDNNNIELIWLNNQSTYKLLVNGVECEGEYQTFVKDNKSYNKFSCNIIDAGSYVFEIYSEKEGDNIKQFLKSEKYTFKKIVKLNAPVIDFDFDNLKLNYNILENENNYNLSLNISKGEFLASESVLAENLTGFVNLDEAYFNEKGDYSINISLSKEENGNAIYLTSSVINIVISNLENLNCEMQIDKANSQASFIIKKEENVSVVQIKLNEQILTKSSENLIYISSEKEIEDATGKYIKITISGLTEAKQYDFSLQALGDKTDDNHYVLNSNTQSFVAIKLNSPAVNYLTDKKKIMLSWQAIDNAQNYQIFITNLNNNNVFSTTVNECEFEYSNFEVADYKIEVVACSGEDYVINSNIFALEIKKLASVANIQYQNNSGSSEIVFDKVDFATGYSLNLYKLATNALILTKNNFVIENGKIIFNLGAEADIFVDTGEYYAEIIATSEEQSVLDSNIATYSIFKLSTVNGVDVNYQNGKKTLVFDYNTSNVNFLISIDGADYTQASTTFVDVSQLLVGEHHISIICTSNFNNILNSDVFSAYFEIKEVLSAPTNVEISIDETDDSVINISFNAVENASKYLITLTNANGTTTSTFTPSSIASSYVYKFNRQNFVAGYNEIKIVSSSNNSVYENSSAVSVAIKKSAEVNKVETQNDYINLANKQAIINGNVYSNISTPWPELQSGEFLTIKVRNISEQAIDGYDSENAFNLASEWVSVKLQKLTTPQIQIANEDFSINYEEEISEYDVKLIIEYLGIAGKISQTATYNFVITENALNIEEFILNNITASAYEGDYKISLQIIPTMQENFVLYAKSNVSNILNYKITKQLYNSQLAINSSNYGDITLSQSVEKQYEIDYIEISVLQNNLENLYKLNLSDLSIATIKNEIKSFDLIISKNIKNNLINYSFNIYNLISEGEFVVCYKVIGDENYFISASEFCTLALTKLDSPQFEYGVSNDGNVIEINNIINSVNVNYIAMYNNEVLYFTKEESRVYFVIPFEWENANLIKIQVITTYAGFVNSDLVNVSFEKLSAVENVHLTENSTLGKTFIVWNENPSANKYLIYLSQDAFNTYQVFESAENSFELTDNYLYAGDVQIRVVCKGYSNYFNSNFTQLNAVKLESDLIQFSTPNGVFTWNEIPDKSQIKEFRINLSGELINLETSVSCFNFENREGMFNGQFKLVGNPTENVISSNYVDFCIYKFAKPTSFKIEKGKISVNENYLTVIQSALDDYKINYNNLAESGSFYYNDYLNYSDAALEDFYNKLSVSSGQFSAKALALANMTFVLNNITYMVVNSDETNNIDFCIYEIDVTNDEFYLTQQENINGYYATYFNYEFIDENYVNEPSVRIIFKPKFLTTYQLNVSGFTNLIDNNYISCYYIDYPINNRFDTDSNYIGSYISLELPQALPAGEYEIQIQKTALNSTVNLSSKHTKVVLFTKLETPNTAIGDGRLNWDSQLLASKYVILFNNGTNKYWENNITNCYFEPGSLYADAVKSVVYSYYISAIGNVGSSKPTETQALATHYVVASSCKYGELIKLQKTGNLTLNAGSLVWENSELYKFYSQENIDSSIELYFENVNGEKLISCIIPASDFDNGISNLTNLLNKYLVDGQINLLNNSTEFLIKYRQFGETKYINSEYKYLEVSGAPTITLNGQLRNKFSILKQVSSIGINDTVGLYFTGSSYNTSYMDNITYEIVFGIKNDSGRIEYQVVKTLTNFTSVSFTEIKDLLKIKDQNAKIAEIFVIAKGNSTYYLTSLKSPIQNVKAINGEATMIIDENGNIKWNEVGGADSYEFKVLVGDNEITLTVFEKYDKYWISKNGETPINASSYITKADGYFTFDISSFDEISSGEVNEFYLRYIPLNNEKDVYAIPGRWSDLLRVFKVKSPLVSLVSGNLAWEAVDNAQSYTLEIFDENGESLLKVENLSETGYALSIYELAELYKTKYVKTENLETIISNYIVNSISNYKFVVNAIGGGVIDGIYYLTSTPSTLTGVNIKTNTVSNVNISESLLTWEDSSNINSYILIIYNSDNSVRKEITLSEKSFDLSSLNLPSEYAYSVVVKILGDSGNLSSLENAPKEFKVFSPITELEIKNGLIRFTPQENANNYKIRVNLLNYYYDYIISKNGNAYSLVKLIVINKSNSQAIEKSADKSELFVDVENGQVCFWPESVVINSNAWISVCVYAEEKDGAIYISSSHLTYSTSISKVDTSQIKLGEMTTEKLILNCGLANPENYMISVVIYSEADEQVYSVVNQALLKINDFALGNLGSGNYRVVIQITPSNETNLLKSNFKTFNYSVE